MQPVTAIGLDIAKSIFQVHGIDAKGKAIVRRKLKPRYVLAFFERKYGNSDQSAVTTARPVSVACL